MVSGTVKVLNKNGIHLRLANVLVKTAGQFESEIMITKNGLEVNGKSILGVAGLGAEEGAELEITATGEDEKQALGRLVELFNNRFEIDEED